MSSMRLALPTRPAEPAATRAGPRETALIAGLAALLMVAASTLFVMRPDLDLAASRSFHREDGFTLAVSGFWSGLRDWLYRAQALFYVVIAAGLALAIAGRRPFGRPVRDWAYLVACAILGPALLVNGLLKAWSGRPRPRDSMPFGGEAVPIPVWDFGGSCLSNCSFVSGEVASTVMIFASLAFVAGRWRPHLWAACLFFGGLSAILRVGQGAHYLSDSLLAGAFMVLIAAGLHAAFGALPIERGALRR